MFVSVCAKNKDCLEKQNKTTKMYREVLVQIKCISCTIALVRC